MTDVRDDLVERLPTAPDDDADFTPALGRKIIAAYQAVLSHEATRIQQLTARAEAAEASLAEAERVMAPFARAAALLNFAGATHSDEVELTGDELHKALRAARAWLDSRRKEQTCKTS